MIKNKNGWGLREMMFFSAIILLAVIVVVVLINNLYNGLPSSITGKTSDSSRTSKSNSYKDIENRLKVAAKKYHQKNLEVNLIISDDLIQNGYITEDDLKNNNDTCSGYVLVSENYKAYISCDKYETEGY